MTAFVAEETNEGSLYARMGTLLGFTTTMRSEVDLIERLERGFAVATVQTLQARAGLTDAETFELIAPRRTLRRRTAAGQSLSREEADKTARIARVIARAQQVFLGRPDYAMQWLRAPKTVFGERTPMQMLLTDSGALAVGEMLVGIGHGMFD